MLRTTSRSTSSAGIWLPADNANDAIAALEAARLEAETVLGVPLIVDVTESETGEIHPVVVVTDNGPAFKSAAFARYIASRPEFTHVRTRRKSPHTNGVRERGYGSLNYEHPYRHEIADRVALAGHAEDYRRLFNEIRPHEHLDWSTPKEVYLTAEPNFPAPETEPLS